MEMGSQGDSLDHSPNGQTITISLPSSLKLLSRVGPLFVCFGFGLWLTASVSGSTIGYYAGLGSSRLGLATNLGLVLGFIGKVHNALVQVQKHRDLEGDLPRASPFFCIVSSQSNILKRINQELSDSQNRSSALSGAE